MMDQDAEHDALESGKEDESASLPLTKLCAYCNEYKPLSHFRRRTGRRAGRASRRGVCRACRKLHRQADDGAKDPKHSARTQPQEEVRPHQEDAAVLPPAPPKRVVRRPLPVPPPRTAGPDVSVLRPTAGGIIRMRGRTDKGRRWVQETDLETAAVLVKEHAAVVVNRHTIRRLYSNKAFRSYILARDRYTCFFCGEYGETIDHLVPRAKGGHTTPMNCVCACMECNQNKADRNLDDFVPSNGADKA